MENEMRAGALPPNPQGGIVGDSSSTNSGQEELRYLDLSEATVVAARERKKQREKVSITFGRNVVKGVITQGNYRFVIFLREEKYYATQIYKRPDTPPWTMDNVAIFKIMPFSETSEIEILDEKLGSSLWLLRYHRHEMLSRVRDSLEMLKEENDRLIESENGKAKDVMDGELIKKLKSANEQISKLDAACSVYHAEVDSSVKKAKLETCLSLTLVDESVKEISDALQKVTDTELKHRVEQVVQQVKQEYVDARELVKTFKIGVVKAE
jgi:hypothetical protein